MGFWVGGFGVGGFCFVFVEAGVALGVRASTSVVAMMWVSGAACVGDASHLRALEGDLAAVAAAVRVCDGCGVRVSCGLQGGRESAGVWGGVLRSGAEVPPEGWVKLASLRGVAVSRLSLDRCYRRLRKEGEGAVLRVGSVSEIWVSGALADRIRAHYVSRVGVTHTTPT